jgi:tRNA(fMet)-specific endonuclease VapC
LHFLPTKRLLSSN